MSNEHEHETLQRVRRIETRLCRLSEHFNVAQDSRPIIEVGIGKHEVPTVTVQAMDVTLSAIYNALLAASIDPFAQLVRVQTPGKTIAVVTFVKD